MRQVPLSEIKEDLSRFLHEVEGGEIVITRNGKPAGVLIGVASEEDWFDHQLGKRSTIPVPHRARAKELTRGHGIRIEDLQ